MIIDPLLHTVSRPSDYISATFKFPPDKVGTWLSAILQSSMDGVIVIDAFSEIVLLNCEAERMFGHGSKHLLGRPMDMLLPIRLRTKCRMQMNRFVAMGLNGKRLRIKINLIGVRANGEEFFIDASISRVTVRGEIFLAIILREQVSPFKSTSTMTFQESNLRKLAVSSQQANEIEKRRFSKELYDDLGQRLSALKLDLDWLEHHLPEMDKRVPERIAQMQGLLRNIIGRTKSIASTLRPPLLDDFGLMPAIKWITENFHKKTSISCTVENHGIVIKAGDPAESAIFRIVQESLLNVERHAQASHVQIILQHNGAYLDIVIQDDGIGMSAGNENKLGCYGLIAMQERIYILGGTMSIHNVKPKGFAIRASIPLEQSPNFSLHL